ncbi:MAG: hypothetical protein IPP15_03820 [Saprospiraceae bacterium]|uniref:Uncharacterized protein n=1 Tax=Candidatus Opimibacter skivensis TaxID=2982028 RepID=A0A9D7SV88_9BACT|nr:hypothetical protein [Candidatus Opimibacter skivensis]
MKKVNRILLAIFIICSTAIYSENTYAQCPMCHITAESNLANGGSQGKGLNAGILYMLALPYTLVGFFGLIVWRNNRRNKEDELEVLP